MSRGSRHFAARALAGSQSIRITYRLPLIFYLRPVSRPPGARSRARGGLCLLAESLLFLRRVNLPVIPAIRVRELLASRRPRQPRKILASRPAKSGSSTSRRRRARRQRRAGQKRKVMTDHKNDYREYHGSRFVSRMQPSGEREGDESSGYFPNGAALTITFICRAMIQSNAQPSNSARGGGEGGDNFSFVHLYVKYQRTIHLAIRARAIHGLA